MTLTAGLCLDRVSCACFLPNYTIIIITSLHCQNDKWANIFSHWLTLLCVSSASIRLEWSGVVRHYAVHQECSLLNGLVKDKKEQSEMRHILISVTENLGYICHLAKAKLFWGSSLSFNSYNRLLLCGYIDWFWYEYGQVKAVWLDFIQFHMNSVVRKGTNAFLLP